MSRLTHLHVHTQYSILDGASAVGKLVARAKELGMESLAITDHGNMFGAKEFHDTATKAGIKPIIGCEAYIVRNRFEKDKNEKAGDHLILLAKNLEGYHNLTRIISYSWIEGFYGKPRADKALLRQYRDGIICSSACLGGEVSQAIMRGEIAEAERAILEYKDIFGEDYYLELMYHPSDDPRRRADVSDKQLQVNKIIAELAAKHGVKTIATNDVHFVLAEDAPAHDRLVCLTTNSELDDPDRLRYTWQEWLKSYDEMAALFPDNLDALANTLEVADKVECYSLDHEPLMPDFPAPDDFVFDPVRLREVFLKGLEMDGAGAGAENGTASAGAAGAESVPARVEAKRLAGRSAQPAEAGNVPVTERPAATVAGIEALAAGNEALEKKLKIARQQLYLEHLTYEGAAKRYPQPLGAELEERIRYELDTVARMGFPGYFLIVWDFIRAAREMGVWVGPGRGSAAGSVVAYCLGITNIDPLPYKLLFERFLNPERISMPDVDIDFDEDGRENVLKYVIGKYGSKRVAQIVTFGKMQPKLAIRDVARIEKLSLSESDRLAKLVPERIGITFDGAYRESKELREERDAGDPLVRETLAYAEKLEGSIRQTGVHACGVIIGSDDLEKFIPLSMNKDAELNVVQYEGKQVESVGLIKMDFLGLKTLSILKDAVENIEEVHGVHIDIDAIDFTDKKTYELYSRGDTTGLFQFESPGMKKHLRNLRPTCLEDLIAMNALYRPGPMAYIDDYVACKNGRKKIDYPLPEMEEYLADTYGVTVYQEQVMLLSQKLAGFTGAQADNLRKAMGKKQRKVLDKMKPKFLEGAAARGHDPRVVEKIWSDWESFAEYAFNKSHSTCYAYLSFQTAYLKAHYPAEFMAALLSRSVSDIGKISFFMDECKRMGLQVLGPDVNASRKRFASDKKGVIRFGLQAIKGVGENAVEHIIAERKAGGEFKSIFDFVERVSLQTVNKKNMECLALAGAFDNISGFHRCKFFAPDVRDAGVTFLEMLMRYGSRVQSDRNNTQQSLFGDLAGAAAAIQRPEFPEGWMWSKLETLNREREVVGIYLSAHPLDEYRLFIENCCRTEVGELNDLSTLNGKDFCIAGMITTVQNLTTKTGNPYGRFTVEGYKGSYQFALFGKDYEKFRPLLYENYAVVVRGRVGPRQYYNKDRKPEQENKRVELEARISSIVQLSEAQQHLREISVSLPLGNLTDQLLDEVTEAARTSKGEMLLKFKVWDPESGVSLGMFARKTKVGLSLEFVSLLENNNLKYTLM